MSGGGSSVGAERELVVGALITADRDQITADRDRVFLQQRAAHRRLFPGCWDVVGGHVEPYETPLAALQREVAEETGWQLSRVLAEVGRSGWQANGTCHTETDYLVEVRGDLTSPQLEWEKHPRYAWVGPGDLSLLDESVSRSGSPFIRDLVVTAHRWLLQTPDHCRKDISGSIRMQVG